MVALRKQRQVDNYKSKASLVYVASFRAASTGDVESNKTKQNKINNPQTNPTGVELIIKPLFLAHAKT